MWISLLIAPSFAGGYFYSDAGIVATGRGGAFVAGADTQFAQYYNPAGLIRIGSPTINVGMSGVQQNVGFRRQRPPTTEDPDPGLYPEVKNQAAPFAVPQLGFATPIGDRVGFAVGFYSPFAPSSEYDEEGPQRYSIKDTLIYQFVVGPSAAFRLHDMLTVGLGLQWNYLQVGEALDITLSGRDDPAGDIAVDARVVDLFTPSFNAGLLFEPVKPLSIGLAVQPATRFRARGSGTLDFTGNAFSVLLTETVYTDDDVALTIELPLVLRAGVAVRPMERLEIEAAAVYQGWSSLDDIRVEDIDIVVESDSPLLAEEDRRVDERLTLPAGLRDTLSLRLGVEGRLTDALELRAGGFWENGAFAPKDISVALVDPAKVQLGAGASVHLLDERLTFDVAAAVLFFPTLQIRDSTVTQIDAGVGIADFVPLVVGNGDLRSRGWVLGLQGRWAFGAPTRSARRDDG